MKKNRAFTAAEITETAYGFVVRTENNEYEISKHTATHKISYVFSENGEMKLQLNATISDRCIWLPRIGFEFKTNKKNTEFTYFGRGRMENYCDMKYHVTTGCFKSNTESEYVSYIVPQEHGNHTGCKELSIIDGLDFYTEDVFEFNVSKYSAEALTKATHIDELPINLL